MSINKTLKVLSRSYAHVIFIENRNIFFHLEDGTLIDSEVYWQ